MGIIRSFLGGAGNAMAQFGQMQLAKNLQTERDESEFLRSKALNKENRGYQTEERLAGQKFTASESALDRASSEGIVKSKAEAGKKDNSTNQMKNAQDFRDKGYPPELSDAIANNALVEIEDKMTGDTVLINPFNKSEIGRLTEVDGVNTWLPEGDQAINADVSTQNRKDAKNSASDRAGFFSSDDTDFLETGGDRKAWEKIEAQRLANDERANKSGDGTMPKESNQAPSPKTGDGETKQIGNRMMSRADYYKAMRLNKYPDATDAELSAAWEKRK
jgi:hypothetical protein